MFFTPEDVACMLIESLEGEEVHCTDDDERRTEYSFVLDTDTGGYGKALIRLTNGQVFEIEVREAPSTTVTHVSAQTYRLAA